MTTISVVMPVYNTVRFVRDAIESVLAQEATGHPIQLIVVDDGSTDGSQAAVRTFGAAVELFEHKHAGIGAARNRGIAVASGELLAFLDADDLWAPGKLRAQIEFGRRNPAFDMVAGRVENFRDTEDGKRLRVGDVAPGYLPGAMLFRRETFERVGPFNETLRAGEFIDWYARATELGLSTHMLDEIVLHRRLHDANTARTSGNANQDVPSVLRAALARRRAAAGEQ